MGYKLRGLYYTLSLLVLSFDINLKNQRNKICGHLSKSVSSACHEERILASLVPQGFAGENSGGSARGDVGACQRDEQQEQVVQQHQDDEAGAGLVLPIGGVGHHLAALLYLVEAFELEVVP